jgi:dolichol kinase
LKASVVGTRYGKTRWFGTRKTVEGTLAFTLSVLGVFYLFFGVDACTLLSIVLTALLEGISTENDNLFVPVFYIIIHTSISQYQLLI